MIHDDSILGPWEGTVLLFWRWRNACVRLLFLKGNSLVVMI